MCVSLPSGATTTARTPSQGLNIRSEADLNSGVLRRLAPLEAPEFDFSRTTIAVYDAGNNGFAMRVALADGSGWTTFLTMCVCACVCGVCMYMCVCVSLCEFVSLSLYVCVRAQERTRG